MANNYGKEQIRVGLKKEAVRLTAETAPTSWVSVDDGSEMTMDVKLLEDKALRGIGAEFPSVAGTKAVAGKVSHPLRANSVAHFLNMLIGAPVSSEVACNTVVLNSNDTIDFTVSSSPYVATIPAGSYVTGASSADAGSLCAVLQTALNAALVGFTVTYSTVTRKFTLIHATDPVKFLWHTGTNKLKTAAGLLGFSDVDTVTAALSVASDVAVSNRVYQHIFSSPASSIYPPTYTLFWDYGISVKSYPGVAAKKFSLKGTNENYVMHDSELLGLSEVAGASIGSPSFADELEALTFQHVTFNIGGSAQADVKGWNFAYDSGAMLKRPLSNSQLASDVVAPSRPKVSGDFDIYFQTETERNKFLATTSNSAEIKIAGNVLAGTVHDGIDIVLPNIQYEGYPFKVVDELIGAAVKFKSVYDVVSSKLATVTVTNLTPSY